MISRTMLLALVALSCSAPNGNFKSESAATSKAIDNSKFVWIEAESTTNTNLTTKHAFSPANETEADVLSGKSWIGVEGKRADIKFAEYKFTSDVEGTFNFYARKFWKHGPYRWRVNNGPWNQVTSDVPLLDSKELRKFTVANWTPAGETPLKRGENTLRVELTAMDGAAAFDAFIFTPGMFIANGKLKPGEKVGKAPNGWFPFEPGLDNFTESAIDLRYLNEKEAGANGHIRTKGDDFVNNAGPLRFWAVNAGPDVIKMDKVSVRYLARFLAKNGVNLVRCHGDIFSATPNGISSSKEDIAALQFFTAEMKKQGIYVGFSIYFPLWLNAFPGQGLDGYSGQHPFAIQYFSDKFLAMYKSWWRDLLTTPNPHTGIPLASDPAVMYAELVNEDSYFFWTFTPYAAIPEAQTIILEKMFGKWLTRKYGSIEKAIQSWGPNSNPVKGDFPAQGRAGIMANGRDGWRTDLRAQDTVRFLAEGQRDFYETYEQYLKKDLGFQGLVCGSNWITADARILGPVDKWTNTTNDFMDRHGYFDPFHKGPAASYSVNKDETFQNVTKLKFQSNDPLQDSKPDYGNPLADIEYNGLPSMISEVNWTMPNRFRTEFAPLAAAYSLLQGTDSVVHFALSGPTWQSHSKFPIALPSLMGQFPALALMYRRGDVKLGATVADVKLGLKDMFELKGAPLVAPTNLDQTRAVSVPENFAKPEGAIDPRSFWVGKVKMSFVDGPTSANLAALGPNIDSYKKVIKSNTGELNWNYESGYITVNTPKTQGVFGFMKDIDVSLSGISVTTPIEYGSVFVTSLDNQPIISSKKLLLQVMTEDKPLGWEVSGGPVYKIENVGTGPTVVKNIQGTVKLNRSDAGSLKITALDLNGYPTKKLASGAIIRLEPNTLYYLLEK